MRVVFLFLMGCGLTLSAADPTPANGNAAPPAPASESLSLSLANLPARSANAEPYDVFFSNNTNGFGSLHLAPAPEVRTQAQLEAVLAVYVGRWRGESIMRVIFGPKLIRFPIEMVFSLTQEDGRQVLLGTTTYENGGQPVVELSRMWVQGGHIVSEIAQGDRIERFYARTRGDSLVWFSEDPKKDPLDYSEIETLHLTAKGDELSMRGFEVQPTARGSVLVCEASDLQRVK